MSDEERELAAKHQPATIRKRLTTEQEPGYLAAAVLGAIDGCVTTFAAVAGATGGGFAPPSWSCSASPAWT